MTDAGAGAGCHAIQDLGEAGAGAVGPGYMIATQRERWLRLVLDMALALSQLTPYETCHTCRQKELN